MNRQLPFTRRWVQNLCPDGLGIDFQVPHSKPLLGPFPAKPLRGMRLPT
jgi:hypothetical protein